MLYQNSAFSRNAVFFKSLVLSNPHLNFEDYERVIPVGLFIFRGNAVHIKEVCN